MAKKKPLTEQEALSERLKLRIEFWTTIGEFDSCVQFLTEVKRCVDDEWVDDPILVRLETYAHAAEDIQNFSDAYFYRYVLAYLRDHHRATM